MKALSLTRAQPAAPEAEAADGNVVPLAAPRRALRWNPRRWLRALGWQGIVGVGLLVAAAGFYVSAVQPLEQRLAEARQASASLRDQIRQVGEGMKGVERPVEQLARFYKLFPNEKTLPDWLDKIFAAAQANGIVLEQGEYKASHDKAGRLMRYEITLPVKGEYPQIRKFLASVAAEVPTLGLDHIQFERQKVGTSTVESKIRLVLYLEQQS